METASQIKKNKKAYLYRRASTKDQAKEGKDSFTRQLEVAQKVCKERGWKLSARIFEEAMSSFKGKNLKKTDSKINEFEKAFVDGDLGEKGEVVLIFEDYDRLARDPLGVQKVLHWVNDLQLEILFANDRNLITRETIWASIQPLLLLVVGNKRATDEQVIKVRRIKDAAAKRNAKIDKGEVVLTCNVPGFYSFAEKQKTYVQTPSAIAVREIIDLCLAGQSLYKISKTLNDKKTPTSGCNEKSTDEKKNKQWSRQVIKSILQNPAIYGCLRRSVAEAPEGNPAGRFRETKNFFGEPICTEEEFFAIQDKLELNSGCRGRYASDHVNIFRRIGKCSYCGKAMSTGVQKFNYKAQKNKKVPYRYLRCSQRPNSTRCENKYNLNLKNVEEEFFALFLKKNPEEIKSHDERALDKKITQKKKEIRSLVAKATSLVESWVGPLWSANPTFRKKKKELEKSHKKLEDELKELQADKTREAVQAANLSDWNKLWKNEKDEGPQKEINRALDDLNIKLRDNEVRKRIRDYLPTIIDKVLFDSVEGKFYVYGKDGNRIYSSTKLEGK